MKPDKATPENTLAPAPAKAPVVRSKTKGDAPVAILDRYLIERDRQGRPERFYRDHRAADPVFRDDGRRLVAGQAYPDTVADMMKIAQHRGWSEVRVSGDEAFRREAWVQGTSLGLQVRGYRPRDRDRQSAGERQQTPSSPARGDPPSLTATVERQLKAASVVVRRLIEDPAARERLMARAVARMSRNIDLGRRPEPPERKAPTADRSNHRDRNR